MNSALRVLQMKRCNVSDDLLSLHALAWNLRIRKEVRAAGKAPTSGSAWRSRDHHPWYELLIEEMDRA